MLDSKEVAQVDLRTRERSLSLRLALRRHLRDLDPRLLHLLRPGAGRPRPDRRDSTPPRAWRSRHARGPPHHRQRRHRCHIYPILKRQSEIGAIGYVSARLVEGIFITIGIISLLTFLFMRQEASAGADSALGEAFVAIYDRAFLIGPGFFAGFANGVVLGYLMYRSGLVPRGMAMLGLIGGPLLMATAIAIMFDATERGGALQAIATIPEFFWELSLGIYHREGIQFLVSYPRHG